MNSGYNFDDTIDSIREDAAGLEMTYELPMEVLSHVEEFGISEFVTARNSDVLSLDRYDMEEAENDADLVLAGTSEIRKMRTPSVLGLEKSPALRRSARIAIAKREKEAEHQLPVSVPGPIQKTKAPKPRTIPKKRKSTGRISMLKKTGLKRRKKPAIPHLPIKNPPLSAPVPLKIRRVTKSKLSKTQAATRGRLHSVTAAPKPSPKRKRRATALKRAKVQKGRQVGQKPKSKKSSHLRNEKKI